MWRMGGKEIGLNVEIWVSEDANMAFQARENGDFLGQGQVGIETSG